MLALRSRSGALALSIGGPSRLPESVSRPAPPARRFISTSAASHVQHRSPYRILFCGTDAFARTVLQSIIERRRTLWEELQLLVPADAGNDWNSRKRVKTPPTKELAQEHGLVVHTLPAAGLGSFELPPALNDPSALLITASFGHLLPPSFLSRFPPNRALNLHPSLLPQLRGAAPLQWALARRFKRTGVTVQEIGPKFDTGRILAQEETDVEDGERYEALEQRLARLGSEVLCETLERLEERLAASWPQSDAPDRLQPPTKAPKLKRSDSEVNWHAMSSRDVEARHRGFSYLYPLTTTLVSSTSPSARPSRVILSSLSLILDVDVQNGRSDAREARADLSSDEVPPGASRFVPSLDAILVKCGGERTAESEEEAWLAVRSLKTEGKKERSAREWIVGYRDRADEQGRLYFR